MNDKRICDCPKPGPCLGKGGRGKKFRCADVLASPSNSAFCAKHGSLMGYTGCPECIAQQASPASPVAPAPLTYDAFTALVWKALKKGVDLESGSVSASIVSTELWPLLAPVATEETQRQCEFVGLFKGRCIKFAGHDGDHLNGEMMTGAHVWSVPSEATQPEATQPVGTPEQVPAWIPCSERMPRHAAIVFVWDTGWKASYVAQWTEEGWDPGDREAAITVTHWMPFPAAPQGQQTGEGK